MSVFAGNLIYAAQEPGRIVKSWVTIPALTTVTTETDVLSNSWDPPSLGCYLVKASIPFDGSSGAGIDVKMRLYVGGVEIDYDIQQTPSGVFVGKIRCLETVDITSLTTVTVKTTVEKLSAGTANCRLVAARTEIFHAGNTGVRA